MSTCEHDAPVPEPVQAEWFRAMGREIEGDYDRLHREALDDWQRAGHGGESTWVGVFKKWLPPAYDVVSRKYIVPEVGEDMFETDIVVLNPSYPAPLRDNEKILVGGVAAAFSVKLTLDAAGIRDGADRAVRLRRGLQRRIGSPRHEMMAPYPVGILAHSHSWKLPGSEPIKNVSDNLWNLDHELTVHPRESLDFVCVSDLGMWSNLRIPFVPPGAVSRNDSATEQQRKEGAAYTSISQMEPGQIFNPVASLVAHLFARFSYYDATLRPMADNLILTGTLGSATGNIRTWTLSDVFTDSVREQLPSRGFQSPNSDWSAVLP